MYQNLRAAGSATSDQSQLPTGMQVGLGVRAAASSRNFSQGNLNQTGGTFDIAIKGQGFFQIQMPDGSTSYTRDGAFQVDSTGTLGRACVRASCASLPSNLRRDTPAFTSRIVARNPPRRWP